MLPPEPRWRRLRRENFLFLGSDHGGERVAASTPSSKAPSWTVSIPIKMFFAHLKRNLASGGERAFPGPRYRLVFSGTIGFAAFAARTPAIPEQAIDDARLDLLAPLAYGSAAIMPLRAAVGGD